MKAFRASILWFPHTGERAAQAQFEDDGLLILVKNAAGRWVVQDIGAWHTLKDHVEAIPVEHLPGRIIAPGFVDLHVHFPQTNVIGSPAEGLLPWLENYTFPEEGRFADPNYADEAAGFFVDELLRNGVTTALTFATSHPGSVDALNTHAGARGLRMISGMVLMDRHAPDYLLNQPLGGVGATEQSLRDTEALIQKWHGKERIGYAITPRFAPTSSEAQLRGAGELACSTRMFGFSRMCQKTRRRSPGCESFSQPRPLTLRCTSSMACCGDERFMRTASISMRVTAQ